MKVAFYTLGCKVNQYETDLMKKQFEEAGYEIVDFSAKSDIYVVNSCSVTNLSTRKTRQELSKAKRKGGIVVLAGCYAQEIKEQAEPLHHVDIIVGNEEKKQLVSLVRAYLTNHEKTSVSYHISDIATVKQYVQKDSLQKGLQVRESVKIEDGCNNFCSYCIIPYVRGRVRSRKLEDIIKEIKALVDSGVGEVVLVGIEIASYGSDLKEDITLIDVIEQVNQIEGLKRIRLGSIEPRVLTNDTILRLSQLDKLCPHFHISVQSLDNEVLKRMNRHYTREDIFRIVEQMRACIPDIAFTCDIIVGFPGETKEEFENTIAGVKQVGFYEVHAFRYSKRKWTRAAAMEQQVEGMISQARSEQLISLAAQLKQQYLVSHLGTQEEVLIEEYKDGYLYGYTSQYIKVKVRGDQKQWGCLLKIELNSIENDYILGSICL